MIQKLAPILCACACLSLSACSFSEDGGIVDPCEIDSDCPPGEVCLDNVCRTASDGGLDGSDGADGDGGDGDGEDVRKFATTTMLGEGGFFGSSGRHVGAVHGGQDSLAIAAMHVDISDGVGLEKPTGRVYLFDTSEPHDDLAQASVVLQPTDDALGGAFGYAISNPCDLNGDGYLDLPVGNHLFSDAQAPNSGRILVFWGDASGLLDRDRSTAHRLSDDLRRQSDSMGQTVLCADFNGDGWDDLLAGGQNAGADDTGLAIIFWGSDSGLAEFPDQLLEPALKTNRQYFGATSLWADLDGDGLEDLAIGGWGLIKGDSLDGPHPGGVLVFAGGADWSSGPSWGIFPGLDAEMHFGGELAMVGSGSDRFLAVGANDYGGHLVAEGNPGGIFLYRTGSSSIQSGLPEQILMPPEGQVDSGFGQAVAWVPDFLGPDRGAILVGMKYGDSSTDGSGGGTVAAFPWDEQSGSFAEQAIMLSAPEPDSHDYFGGAVVPVGDLNDDGLDDFFVSMEGHLVGDIYTGNQTGGVVFFH